jgi:hypothetical protein
MAWRAIVGKHLFAADRCCCFQRDNYLRLIRISGSSGKSRGQCDKEEAFQHKIPPFWTSYPIRHYAPFSTGQDVMKNTLLSAFRQRKNLYAS